MIQWVEKVMKEIRRGGTTVMMLVRPGAGVPVPLHPVAGKALPRHKKITKREKRLQARRLDYERLNSGAKAPPPGSYHRPGSMNK